MKALLFGEHTNEVIKSIQQAGIGMVDDSFDFIISYGGDGMLLKAEYAYPGIPKLLLRNSKVCKLCSVLPNDEVLRMVREGSYSVREVWKIEGRFGEKKIIGMNDIVLHNANPRHAIRYQIWINEKALSDHIIGDGVVVANPLGSTGYYRSITDSFFELGLGLAFNNSTEQSDHMVLKEDSVIRIKVIRGPAFLYADNQEEKFELVDHDEMIIKKSEQNARIIQVV